MDAETEEVNPYIYMYVPEHRINSRRTTSTLYHGKSHTIDHGSDNGRVYTASGGRTQY